jgi:hypothetical protein
MAITVRADFFEKPSVCDELYPALSRASLINFYDGLVADPVNHIDDMALILHVDGADVAVRCSHIANDRTASDIELF